MRIRLPRVLLTLGLALLMAVCVAAPPSSATASRSSASPAATAKARHHWTGSEFVEWTMSGKNGQLGPNKNTDYGKGVIQGWPDRIAFGSKVSPGIKITNGNPTMMNQNAGYKYQPDTWWKPSTWNWSGIFGDFWKDIQNCAKGAAGAFLPTMGGTLAVNLLFKGAKLYVGPYGYAAIAVGGCLGSVFGN